MHLAQPPESWGEDFGLTSGVQMIASSPPEQDPLDDVFGPDPDAPGHGLTASATRDNSEISLDTQRLRAQHNTVGYREGITAGKAGSIQTGFDQGFSLGANIGMKAGQILGLLEGISAALAEAGPTDEVVVRVQGLLSQATAELNPESLFTPDYWASDGTWTYPVTPLIDGDEVTYLDVADQHPLILKWKRMAHDEADRWHVDQLLHILENNESSAQDEVAALETAPRPETTSRDAIEW